MSCTENREDYGEGRSIYSAGGIKSGKYCKTVILAGIMLSNITENRSEYFFISNTSILSHNNCLTRICSLCYAMTQLHRTNKKI